MSEQPFDENSVKEKKWLWMMDYCKKLKWPPTESWAWTKAEKAFTRSTSFEVIELIFPPVPNNVKLPDSFEEIISD